MWRRRFYLNALVVVAAALAGCTDKSPEPPARTQRLKLATTTSMENSGLLDVLLPPFEEAHNVTVSVVAVGTGQALKLGRNGDADVLIVHDPAGEAAFVDKGFGVNRQQFAHNEFVILGPSGGPLDFSTKRSAKDALAALASAQATFVSRGDDSGTHRKEKALWAAAGIEPSGLWYKEVGQGMSATLVVANEQRAYTLSDRATYLSMKDKLSLEVAFEGDPALHNPYSIIAVNPARHPHAPHAEAMRLIAWVTSPEGQDIIGSYEKFGATLFHPDAAPAK